MAELAIPPRPKHPSERDFSNGLKWSFIVHLALGIFVLIQTAILPSKPARMMPSLRVDIVGLPDILKKDLQDIPIPTDEEIKEVTQPPEEAEVAPKPNEEVDAPDPDELVLQEKKKKEREEAKKREQEKKDEAERKARMSNALARIKALNKITAETGAEAKAPPVKGNIVSKGNSLSADAIEAAEASYYDLLREQLRQHWSLPVWIARQNLSAQVEIKVDWRGRLINTRFTKSSGNPQFDEAIRRTLEQSQPFPTPPEELRETMLNHGVSLGFPL